MNFETDTAYIGSHFATTIAYDDDSGITDVESDEIHAWLAQQAPGAIYDFAEESHYGVCEVSGYPGDIIEVTINTPIGE